MKYLIILFLLLSSCFFDSSNLLPSCEQGEIVSVFVKVEYFTDSEGVPYNWYWLCNNDPTCTPGYPVTITTFSADQSTIQEVDFWNGDILKIDFQNGGSFHWGVFWEPPHNGLDHHPVRITFWVDQEATIPAGYSTIEAIPLYWYVGRPAHENSKESDCFCFTC